MVFGFGGCSKSIATKTFRRRLLRLPSSSSIATTTTKILQSKSNKHSTTRLFVSSSSSGYGTQVVQQDSYEFPLVNELFADSGTYENILKYMMEQLSMYNFIPSQTLVATSLCGDEMNRPLQNYLSEVFPHSYSLGGLAGFPFGGITAFRKMKKHIPHVAYDDTAYEYEGNALIVYGPHVGVSSRGSVGHVDRLNVEYGGEEGDHTMCCRSAILAAQHVQQVYRGELAAGSGIDMMDMSQHYVKQSLMPYAEHLVQLSQNPTQQMMELPYMLFESQSQMLQDIIREGSTDQDVQYGYVATFGGIQINTPPGYKDYFVPLKFDLYDPQGNYIANMFELPS